MNMNVQQLQQVLEQNSRAAIRFQLPTGDWIPDHFHVTEVGRVDKNFVDCGGTRRQSAACLLQTWTASDVEHRLVAGKLARILELAQPVLGSVELPVEMEYGPEVAAQYLVSDVAVGLDGLTFFLTGKQTDCLAKDKCGVGECGTSDCCQ
jgi:hypothetical protein